MSTWEIRSLLGEMRRVTSEQGCSRGAHQGVAETLPHPGQALRAPEYLSFPRATQEGKVNFGCRFLRGARPPSPVRDRASLRGAARSRRARPAAGAAVEISGPPVGRGLAFGLPMERFTPLNTQGSVSSEDCSRPPTTRFCRGLRARDPLRMCLHPYGRSALPEPSEWPVVTSSGPLGCLRVPSAALSPQKHVPLLKPASSGSHRNLHPPNFS